MWKFSIFEIVFINFFIVIVVWSFQDALNPFCNCGYEVKSCHYSLWRSNWVTEIDTLYKKITNTNNIILNGDEITAIKTLVCGYTDKMVKPFWSLQKNQLPFKMTSPFIQTNPTSWAYRPIIYTPFFACVGHCNW